VKCSPAPTEAVDSPIYSLKEGCQECRSWPRTVRRRGRAPVDGMACGIGLVLAVDLCPVEASDSCESRGQGQGLGHVPEPT
jgi:hypothetical protein